MELILVTTLTLLAFRLAPTPSPADFPRPHACPWRIAPRITWLSPCLKYYSAVRLLAGRRSSLHITLIESLTRRHSGPPRVLLGSRMSLPHRAIRKHLGTRGG